MRKSMAALAAALSLAASATTVTVDNGLNVDYYAGQGGGRTEVHAIGIYQAGSNDPGDDGMPVFGGPRVVRDAFVYVDGYTSSLTNLVLSSYEPTTWHLVGPSAPFIRSVMLHGWNESTVTGLSGEAVAIERFGGEQWGVCAYTWAGTPGCRTPEMASLARSIYGVPVTSFSGAYEASRFSVHLAPVSAVPEPASSVLAIIGLCLVMGVWLMGRRGGR